MSERRDVGERLRQAREGAGLSQSSLGKRIGSPQSFVSAIERGLRPRRFDTYVELARLVNLDPISVLADVAASLGRPLSSVLEELLPSTLEVLRLDAVRGSSKAERRASVPNFEHRSQA
jgi:transcriptional regulator with XRE-family HTH domain